MLVQFYAKNEEDVFQQLGESLEYPTPSKGCISNVGVNGQFIYGSELLPPSHEIQTAWTMRACAAIKDSGIRPNSTLRVYARARPPSGFLFFVADVEYLTPAIDQHWLNDAIAEVIMLQDLILKAVTSACGNNFEPALSVAQKFFEGLFPGTTLGKFLKEYNLL